MPALWSPGQTRSVLDNFSAVLIQVKNHKQPRRGEVADGHDRIQKMANEIFKTGMENKPCVSLFMQLGGKKLFQGMEQVEMRSFGTLRVSLVGLAQYGYQGPDLEQLDLLVKYSYGSIIQGRLFAKDDNARPFDEIESTFFDIPEARDGKKGGQFADDVHRPETRHHKNPRRRSTKHILRWFGSRGHRRPAKNPFRWPRSRRL